MILINMLFVVQLEQYKKDFEAEKTLRQELSNEREHILTDLQHALAATGSRFVLFHLNYSYLYI